MVVLPRAILQAIEADAAAAYPSECCGLLTGHPIEDNGIAITGHVASANLSAEPRRAFEIEPQLWLDLARDPARGLVGLYHSHPDGDVRPSAADARAAWPIAGTDRVLWLILTQSAGRPPRAAAYLWQAGDTGFTEAPLRLLD